MGGQPGVAVPLVGPGGEPVDLWRTLNSHGLTSLPPAFLEEDRRTLEVTLRLGRGRPRTVTIEEDDGTARVTVSGRAPGMRTHAEIAAAAARLLRLDADLTDFYGRAATDPALSWVTGGAGRMMRGGSLFEDVVKTICTTNCSWGATVKMVSTLVAELGEPAVGAPRDGARGRAFPSADAMAAVDERFYRDVVRAGYRAPYLRRLAVAVAEGELDLERLAHAQSDEISDEDVVTLLRSLPGIGPYGAAHIMMLLGRYSFLIFDSWTRPKYARLTGRPAKDATIMRRFRRYGEYAGLAFWLFLTRDWADD